MDKIIFYKEKSTGKCIPSNLALPSDKYIKLKPNTADAPLEKHVPVYKIEGNDLLITVGSIEHPMTSDHYIMWIALINGEEITLKGLSPEDTPTATFQYKSNSEIYAYCNLHGLWKTEVK